MASLFKLMCHRSKFSRLGVWSFQSRHQKKKWWTQAGPHSQRPSPFPYTANAPHACQLEVLRGQANRSLTYFTVSLTFCLFVCFKGSAMVCLLPDKSNPCLQCSQVSTANSRKPSTFPYTVNALHACRLGVLTEGSTNQAKPKILTFDSLTKCLTFKIYFFS